MSDQISIYTTSHESHIRNYSFTTSHLCQFSNVTTIQNFEFQLQQIRPTEIVISIQYHMCQFQYTLNSKMR